MARPAMLQINQAGSWRNVIHFDVDTANYDAMEDAAANLVLLADGPDSTATLRTVNPTTQPPTALRRWNAREGWRNA